MSCRELNLRPQRFGMDILKERKHYFTYCSGAATTLICYVLWWLPGSRSQTRRPCQWPLTQISFLILNQTVGTFIAQLQVWLTECNLCVFPRLSCPDNSASHLDFRIFLLTGFSSLQLNPGKCWIPCVFVCSLGSTSPFPKLQLPPRMKHHQDNSKLDDGL